MLANETEIAIDTQATLQVALANIAKTFKALNLSGDVRIDFLIDKKNQKVYVNEPNIIPGSLAFYLWKPVGKDYATLLDDIITLGIKEYKAKNNKVTTFESNILSTYNGGSKGMKNKMGQ